MFLPRSLPTHVANWSNAWGCMDSQKTAFYVPPDDLFVCFEHGLQMPEALRSACSCVHVLHLHQPENKQHVDGELQLCVCVWAQMLFWSVFCVTVIFVLACAFVVLDMNKYMDTVPRAPLYYFWFIVQHKQFDSLILFHVAAAVLIWCWKWKQLHLLFTCLSSCLSVHRERVLIKKTGGTFYLQERRQRLMS